MFAMFRVRIEPGDFDLEHRARSSHGLAGAILMISSFLMLTLRSRQPRAPIRRLVLQPGTSACFVVTVAALYDKVEFDMGQMLAVEALWRVRSASDWIYFLTSEPSYKLACIVPVTWILLALGRRQRPEPGWIDRSGRLLGWGWIAWGISGTFLQ